MKNFPLNTKIAVILILTLLILFMILLLKNRTKENNNQSANITGNQTANPSPLISQTHYKIIAVNPADQEKNVSLKSKIEITLNSEIENGRVQFFIDPKVPFSMAVNGNFITITPEINFQPGTKYTYILRFAGQTLPSRTYAFFSTGSITNIPDTRPIEGEKQQAEFQRENHPDVFLSNNVPYQTAAFSVESEFASSPVGHFRFTVTQKSTAGKNDFLSWLQSLELTEDQITNLDIIYE